MKFLLKARHSEIGRSKELPGLEGGEGRVGKVGWGEGRKIILNIKCKCFVLSVLKGL